MKKHGILLMALFMFALLAARPSLPCADEGAAGRAVPDAMKNTSTGSLHPLQTISENALANIYGNTNIKKFFPPLSGVWQTGEGLYRLLLPGLTTTMEWGTNLQWSAQSKPFSGIDFTKEILLKPDQPDVFAGFDQIPYMNDDENRPVLAASRHQDLYDGLISLSYPITAARSLTITPIVSYSFAVNGGNRQELKNRGINNESDTIVYGGGHVIFTF